MQNILFWKKVCHFLQETDMSSIAMIYGSINIYAMFNFTETLKNINKLSKTTTTTITTTDNHYVVYQLTGVIAIFDALDNATTFHVALYRCRYHYCYFFLRSKTLINLKNNLFKSNTYNLLRRRRYRRCDDDGCQCMLCLLGGGPYVYNKPTDRISV